MTDASDAGMADSMPSTVVAAGTLVAALGPEPPPSRPRERTAWQLAVAARSCSAMGSRLYGHLLERAAADCSAGGPTWDVLAGHVASGRADALALRFMAAVHRLVLEGRAPRLAAFYPSVGGSGALAGVWTAFRATAAAHVPTLRTLVGRPCQTNEVGRSAGLAVGFAAVMVETGLPLQLLEVGASAGLNLRVDRFRIGGGGAGMGPQRSPVDLSSHWSVPPPAIPPRLAVAGRRGCDLDPVDPTTVDGRLTLTSAVWADQRERHARLCAALDLASRVPAVVDRASLDEWARRHLAVLPRGVATVVYHSVVAEYLDDATRAGFTAAIKAAGARATAERPLAWVRLEPISRLRHHGVQVTRWPGGDTTTLARCGAHGTDVEWLGGDNGGRQG